MFAQLGDHKFEGLKSPASLTDRQAVKFGRVSLINGKDVLQLTGEELAEATITILYAIDFCEPSTEIKALKKSMKEAATLPFIMGDGTLVGKYVITGIDVTNQRYSPKGVVEAASVTVNLLECATKDDKKPTGIAVVKINAPIATTKVAVKPPSIPMISPAKAVTSQISKGQNAVNKMKAVGKDVKNGTTKLKRGVRDVRKLADTAKQAYSTAKTKVEATKKIIQRAGELPTSLDGAIKYAENLAKLDDVADVSVLNMNITEMSASADKVTASAAPVVAFAATKEGGK